MISERNPTSRATSGATAPLITANVLNPLNDDEPADPTPSFCVSFDQSPNDHETTPITRTIKDRTLNVKDAAARFVAVSVIIKIEEITTTTSAMSDTEYISIRV
jgi:hypothetical protein